VIGERPYVEGNGDRADLSLAQEDVDAVANMKAAGIPVVVILYSGRPMILGGVLEKSRCRGGRLAAGHRGRRHRGRAFWRLQPTGKLSFAWPRSMAQVARHPGDKDYDPLFAFGYGLSY